MSEIDYDEVINFLKSAKHSKIIFVDIDDKTFSAVYDTKTGRLYNIKEKEKEYQKFIPTWIIDNKVEKYGKILFKVAEALDGLNKKEISIILEALKEALNYKSRFMV